ncbi:MAG: hypothetical protein JNK84_02750 [Phreatobacter sp.]|uniref:hypothetical protein n=1 Tax=Phreatobacter sp. TaxID=1966341 RepID=UPI001A6409B8|nr:hypothetical protein [Phreatobacter sp.]MBL8567982.1 hypothetical protein [Phreatobacter sp.]
MTRRTDSELLAGLRALIVAGAVELRLDPARLDKTDSPVSVQAESTRWLYALVALALGAAWLGGAAAFGIAAALGAGLWFGWVRRDVARRIRDRVETRALVDVTLWRRLWRFGGVRLVATADGAACSAPDDNWMQYVRDRSPVGHE